jgi:WD40 repeat protein
VAVTALLAVRSRQSARPTDQLMIITELLPGARSPCRVDALEPVAAPLRHQGQVWVTAFRPAGRVLLTGGDGKTIHLWDTATGRPFGPSMDHASPFRLAAFAPNGRDVFIGNEPGKSRFWDLGSAKPLGARLEADAWILAAGFDPVTGEVITASEGVTLERWPMPRPLKGDSGTIASQIQAMTGLRLQPGGSIEVLDRTAWQAAVNLSHTLNSARQGTRAGADGSAPDRRGQHRDQAVPRKSDQH